MFFSYLYWDPPKVAFYIPIIHHPIVWYSILFAGGFFVGYLLACALLSSYLNNKKQAVQFLDHLAWYVFIGMVVGARLGHVFFYEWPYFKDHPLEILFTWEGGLSSHGGGIGLLVGVLLFWANPKRRLEGLNFKRLLDVLCVATAFVAGMIRVGNFFNQEILGSHSLLPFAVWFGHPADPGAQMPCHPVQMYEAIYYFINCFILYKLFAKLSDGKTAGLFFVSIFTFRFFIEYLKLPQGVYDTEWINMGQLLSVPFIAIGLALLKSGNTLFKRRVGGK